MSTCIEASSVTRGHPWARFLARLIDYALFGSAVGFACPSLLVVIPAPELIGNVILMFAYAFIEALMLCLWGATPGKALLGVRVQNRDGSRLSYVSALRRSFRVWLCGEWAGIPISLLIPQYCAYRHLIKHGETTWDAQGGFAVTHRSLRVWWIAVVVLLFVLFVLV